MRKTYTAYTVPVAQACSQQERMSVKGTILFAATFHVSVALLAASVLLCVCVCVAVMALTLPASV
jgi:hypothetical protein